MQNNCFPTKPLPHPTSGTSKRRQGSKTEVRVKDGEIKWRLRLFFPPAGTLRFCENTDQNTSGMNILESTISLTRGAGFKNDILIQQMMWKKSKICYRHFRNNGVKHVVYYPSLKVSLFFVICQLYSKKHFLSNLLKGVS